MNIIDISTKLKLEQAALSLSKQLSKGSVVALVGDLGSGKTTFTKLVANYLGIKEIVQSPTFVIEKRYQLPNKGSFIHVDAYRLDSSHPEWFDFLDTEVIKSSIIFIEWADKIKPHIPSFAMWLKFNLDPRRIKTKEQL